MLNGKEMEAPTIMYYLEHEDCKKLLKDLYSINQKIFLI